MKDGERSAHQYNAMAVDYAADNAESPYNAYYERPATISLLGDVEGRRVLEAGCGAGVLTGWLVEHTAAATAFDVSDEMVAIAKNAVGDRAKIVVADLGEPLSFAADHSFDLVVASLALHYVEDWASVFRGFHRVLTPRGAVVFSTHHPPWSGSTARTTTSPPSRSPSDGAKGRASSTSPSGEDPSPP